MTTVPTLGYGRWIPLTLVMVVRSGLTLAVPALLASAVTATLDRSAVGWPIALLVAALSLAAVTEVVLGQWGMATVARATVWLQARALAHLLGVGPRSTIAPGDAIARVTQAAPGVAGLPLSVAGAVISVAGSAVALVALFVIDWRAGLTFVVMLPVAVWIARRFIGGVSTVQTEYYQAQGRIAGRLLAALAGARTIRAAGTTEAEVERVLQPLPGLSAAGRAMWRLQRGAVWRLQLLVPLTQVAVLAVAGLGVAAGRTRPAELLAVAGYLTIASGALDQIDVLLELAYVRAGLSRLGEIFAEPAPADGADPIRPGPGAVSLRGVTVEPVLRDLHLDVPAGRSVALVGCTGAGKSTVGALVGRLADPDSGEVLLDGIAVRTLARADLRQAVSYAFERPELVGESIHDTIAYGRPELTRAEVRLAAGAAGADGFVMRLPEGYDTARRGAPMSGGERQRIGLARALARPARVYVLDDATSGLDTVTEAEVTESITTRLAGRTRLVVAHRAATAARCDLVAWLDSGRVRAVGPHAELWRDPSYRAVFALDSPERTDDE